MRTPEKEGVLITSPTGIPAMAVGMYGGGRAILQGCRLGACRQILVALYLAGMATAIAAGVKEESFGPRSLPFTRRLEPAQPPMEGTDVLVLQLLLSRAHDRANMKTAAGVPMTGVYDDLTARAVGAFRGATRIGNATDESFDASLAVGLLARCSDDDFVWNASGGITPGQLGYKYMIWLPVHHNRSIETEASLIGTDGSVVYTFTARAHGHRDDGTGTWPDFWNDVGLNEFTTNGNTPTGLMEIDLNTPESDTEVYGKSNINRVIRGLMGNAETIVPAIRDGILIHSGAWPGWVDGAPMPNSAGCVHVHPDALAEIADLLRQMGVEARPNPEGSSAPYAFRGQGLMAVQRFGR